MSKSFLNSFSFAITFIKKKMILFVNELFAFLSKDLLLLERKPLRV